MDPFTELRKHAGGAHPQKVKLNVVLSAICDVIYERRTNGDRQAPISPTEYFAALMTALDAASDSHRQEIAQLLCMVLPAVPDAVLRGKFAAVAKCLITVLQEAGDDAALLRSASASLALTLLAQEPSTTAWSRPELLRSFQLLLALAMDSRPKVRKAGHKWVVDILELHAAKGCDVLSTHIASFAENVFASFKKGDNDDQRLVLLVAFLKLALPLLQRKVVASLVAALAQFLDANSKTLRLVTYEALDALSSAPEAQLTADALQKLVVAVLDAQSSDSQEAQGSPVAISAVRIPSEALIRLAAVNAEAAYDLLPRVVSAVCSHLSTDSDRVQRQATRSLLSVVKATVIPELFAAKDTNENVARVLASLQSLTSLRFQSAWSHTFPLLADLFRFYGKTSRLAFEPIIITCCELHEAAHQLPQQEQKEKSTQLFALAAGAAVEAMGPQAFLEIVPIAHPTEIVSEQRAWLLPVFRDALRATRGGNELSFFTDVVLPLARACEAGAREATVTPLQAKNLQTRAIQLWNLFPSVCARAVDIDSHFKKIAKVLASAMADKRYPELRLAVCQGLQALVKRTRALEKSIARRYHCETEDILVEDAENEGVETEADQLDEAKLARDRAALAKFSGRYVPLLLSFVEEVDPEKDTERAQVLLDTLEGFFSLADAHLISTTFKKVMQKLLEATTEAKRVEADGTVGNSKRATKLRRISHAQMALALALLTHVDDANVALLYRVIKPYLLDDADACMQKRSYAALVAICDSHPTFLSEESQLQDLTRAICESLLTCSVPAKKMRLRVLAHLIRALQAQPATDKLAEKELVPNLVGEIMLCTKEANGKAREAAFELLVAMATLLRARDPQNGIMEFIQMVLGGLAARTPHMRSAAVICLSRLVFEFGREDAAITQAMPALLKTVLMLLHEKAREVIKSVIGFMKLGIAVLSKDQLAQFVPDMVNGLLVWIGESKNRFRAKNRIILIKLCRKFGYEHVAALVPEEDRALIRHIKKTKEREDKKKSELAAEAAERRAAKKNRNSFEDFMADSDDEGDDVEAAAMQVLKRKKDLHRKHKGGKMIREDSDDIMDFLDDNAAVKNIFSAQRGRQDNDESDDDFQMSKDGRLIIPQDENDGMDGGSGSGDDMKIKQDVATQLQRMGLHSKGKNGKGDRIKRKRDEDGSTGREYRAKKAGGDLKKKGKLEPYAYLPLDPKLMAKRNKREAVTRYGGSMGKRRGKK